VPASLAAATQLRHLDISNAIEGRFALAAADVAVLSALPALAMLRLRNPERSDDQEWKNYRLAQLQAAFLAQGRAPPVVSIDGWMRMDSISGR
jgi:hypothetical protein